MRYVDLSDLRSVDRFVERTGELDVVVLNAAVVTRSARRSAQGHELMLAVNYLAHAALLDGLLPKLRRRARIVAISSESHRSVEPPDPSSLATFTPYDVRGAMRVYSETKLLLSAWTCAMGRRHPELAFHHTCPGAVATNIARDAPALARPLLDPMMRAFFRSPDEAAAGAEHLCCARAHEGRTGLYLHVLTEKPAAPACDDVAYGEALLEATRALR